MQKGKSKMTVEEEQYMYKVAAIKGEFELRRGDMSTQIYVCFLSCMARNEEDSHMKLLIVAEMYSVMMDEIGEVLRWGDKFLQLARMRAREYIGEIQQMRLETKYELLQMESLDVAEVALRMFIDL